MADINPFDYVKSINETKENLMVDELTEKSYSPFLTNRALSYFIDTVFQANEMNRLHFVGKKTQYQFLLNSVRQKKRWAGKWHKAEANNADIDIIMTHYGYSQAKARTVLSLLTPDNLKEIHARHDPGGVVKGRTKQ